ncbi:hypothetical protein ACQV5M_19620, partial [Leptospira sp. SA-E8]|uniref:hypothetical protein n=1 Tax=Leptospira sp. SA-E8 TaxID=3422259 RepID=UPI003EB8A020
QQKTDGWSLQLRESSGEPFDFDDGHDLAFVGSKTLLNQEQGVRGFSLAMNDLLWSQAIPLGLDQWVCEDVDIGETRDKDIDTCIEAIEAEPFTSKIRQAIECLAEFDWRSFDAPGLSQLEEQVKAGYRGTGGYSRIRLALLEEISKQQFSLGKAAADLLVAERL